MSDALKIPQLTLPPTTAARGTEGTFDGPQTSEATTDSPLPGPSFAAVLKSKSAPPDEDPAGEVVRQPGAEDPSLLALIAGISATAENPPAVRLLARLTDDRQDRQAASLADATEVPAALQDLAAKADLEVERPAPSEIAALTPPFAAPAALPTPLAAIAVSTAPTSGSLKAPAPGSPPPAVVLHPDLEPAPETPAGLPPPNAVLAASTAISAEAGKSNSANSGKLSPEAVGGKPSAEVGAARPSAEVGAARPAAEAGAARPAAEASAEMPKTEAAGEFRTLLERMSDRPGPIATQTAAASQAMLQQPASAAVQVRLTTPFAQPGWTQEVDQTLNWIVTTARQQADLVLNPPELGRIEVTLVIKGDEVSVSFASPHQAVREAIEESMVRLRESLAEAGISLGQTHVGRDSSRDAPFARPAGDTRQARGMHNDSPLTPTPGSLWVPSHGRGMVDVFA